MNWKQVCISAFLTIQLPLSLSLALADEVLPIGKIIADASSLAQHLVTFRGTVTSLEQIPSFPTRGCFLPDRYRAIIEDETGSIEVLFCRPPGANGDHVLIQAVISIINSEGFTSTLQATAKYVERTEEDVK